MSDPRRAVLLRRQSSENVRRSSLADASHNDSCIGSTTDCVGYPVDRNTHIVS